MSEAAPGPGSGPRISNPGPPPSWSTTDAATPGGDAGLPLAVLEQRIASTRRQLEEVQTLLEDLPAIFEQRFLGRLEPLLEQRQRLLSETGDLRSHLFELQLHGRPLRALEGSATTTAGASAAGDSNADAPSLRQRLLAALGRHPGEPEKQNRAA